MKHITFYLDFISPYAYLAFKALPPSLLGLSYSVTYKPVFLGGLLKHYQKKGPAEFPSQRAWLYRQVQWLAHHHGVAMDIPAQHPFNPLGLLRLALACDAQGQPNRYVCETLFAHAWVGGLDAADAIRLQEVSALLAPLRDPKSEAVKQELSANGQAAIAQGVFGVPAFEVDGKVFWGLDALPMLRDYIENGAWFAQTRWDQADNIHSAIPL